MSAKAAERSYQFFIYVIIGVLVLVSIFPLIYVLCLSFTSEAEYLQRGYMMIVPHSPTLNGYKKILLTTPTYIIGLGVSVLRTLVGTTTNMVCTLTLGYLLSKKDLPGGKVLFFAVLLTVLYSAGMVPTFLNLKALGLVDTFWAMILPMLVDSWSVLVYKQAFEGLPKEVLESASIDGCGEIRMLLSIAVPMSKPTIAALGLFSAVAHWNSWFDALIYIQKNKQLKPLQLLLQELLVSTNLGRDMSSIDLTKMETQTPTSLRMVVVVIGTVPILCVYPFLQKYFTAGMYVGAVKE